MSEKICPVCGVTLPEQAKFCYNCGSKLAEEVKVLVCEICGYENEVGSRYCVSCGSILTGALESTSEKESGRRIDIEFKPPKVQEHKREKEVKQRKQKRFKISSTQVFYAGLAVVFLLLVAYGVMRKEKEKAVDVHQHPEINSEIMAEINKLRERVNSNPDDIQATLKLANLLQDVHIFDQAVEYYRRYLERNESDPDARVDMGICLFELGKVNEAIAEMEKALSYAPNHQLALYNLGVVNLATGNVEKAREYFNKCIDVNPNADVAQKAKRMLEQHKF
jgi:tetratricopeptide (TPR) repeat protein